MAQSRAGATISKAVRLRQAMDMGVTVTLAEVTPEDLNAMAVIEEEKEKLRKEQDEQK